MLAIGRLLCQPRPGCGLLRSLRSGPVLDLPLTGMRERFPHIVYQKEVKVPSFGGSLWVNSEIPVKVAPTGELDASRNEVGSSFRASRLFM